MRCFSLHEVEIKVVFILKVSCFLFASSLQLTLKGTPLAVCALQLQLSKNTKRLVSPSNRVYLQLCDSRKIHCLTREFHVKFHHENFTIADWLRACQLIPNSAES